MKKSMSGYVSLSETMRCSNDASASRRLDGEELIALQQTLLGMYCDLFRVCNDNGLKIGLTAGTLLGKVRHNGFIPWDDDLDLHMSRNDYDCFRSIFSTTELAEKYYITGPKCKGAPDGRFLRVYKKDSFLSTMLDNTNAQKKISIDIFPLDYVPDNTIRYALRGMRANILMACASLADYYNYTSESVKGALLSTRFGRANYLTRQIFGFFMAFRKMNKWYEKIDETICNSQKSKRVTSATGRKHYFGEVVDADVYFPFKPSEFCGYPAWIPNKTHLYLKNRYGAYMDIPSKDNRESHFIIDIDFGN